MLREGNTAIQIHKVYRGNKIIGNQIIFSSLKWLMYPRQNKERDYHIKKIIAESTNRRVQTSTIKQIQTPSILSTLWTLVSNKGTNTELLCDAKHFHRRLVCWPFSNRITPSGHKLYSAPISTLTKLDTETNTRFPHLRAHQYQPKT